MLINTVTELLRTPRFKNNQSQLARVLDCNRGTLRKYLEDVDGKYHEVRIFNGKIQLMTLNSRSQRG